MAGSEGLSVWARPGGRVATGSIQCRRVVFFLWGNSGIQSASRSGPVLVVDARVFLVDSFLLGASLQAGSGNNQVSRGMPCFCETISILDIVL